jgi:hypothetical protein
LNSQNTRQTEISVKRLSTAISARCDRALRARTSACVAAEDFLGAGLLKARVDRLKAFLAAKPGLEARKAEAVAQAAQADSAASARACASSAQRSTTSRPWAVPSP